MNRFSKVAIVTLVLAAPGAASAQTTEQVHFAPGNYGTLVTGKVTGQGYVDYLLGAGGGQRMFVELTVTESNGDGTVYFNILPPGSTGEAMYIGSMDGNSTLVPLPDTGTYTIRVYQMGNDKDSGKTSAYNIDLSIQ